MFSTHHQCETFDIVISIDYETWQPPTKELQPDWEKDVFSPAFWLMDTAEKHGVSLTFFVEMGEYYWLKQYRSEIAQKMEKQIQEMVRRGHDVQLHLHPAWLPELGVKYENGKWSGLDKNQRLHDIPLDLYALLRRCKRDLEVIVQKVIPGYKAMVFRAAKYQIQPTGKLFRILKDIGIEADSSVWKEGYSKEYTFDFRKAPSFHQPYIAHIDDATRRAFVGEDLMPEIPIFSYKKRQWNLNSDSYEDLVVPLVKEMKSYEGKHGGLTCQCKEDVLFGPVAHPTYVMIGHTKLPTYQHEVGRFFEFLAEELRIKRLRSRKISEIASEIWQNIDREFEPSAPESVKIIELMRWCYARLDPTRVQQSNDPIEIVRGEYAWCAGYVAVMKYLCEREGFGTRSYTLFAKNHPKGRGSKKIDTHNVLEVKVEGRWVLFDPLLNLCFYASLTEVLERPELTDGVLEDAPKDVRWREKEYELYCGRNFYGNIIKVISHDTGLRAIARRVKKFLWRKTS